MSDSEENDNPETTPEENNEVPPVEGVEVPLVESVEVPLVEPDNNYSKATVQTSDDELRNFGIGIAVCAILLLYGGETFAIWNVQIEQDFVDEDIESWEFDIKFGTNEMYIEQPKALTDEGGNGTDSDSKEYDDNDCSGSSDCDEMYDFFSNLKILLYVLLIGGVFIAYMGNTGEKMEFAPRVIAGAALVSVLILLYIFFSLPAAYDEDTDFFDDMDEDPAFFSDNKEKTNEGTFFEADVESKTTFSLGFFIPLVSAGLAGYLINARGIKLEDITGKK